MRLRNWIWVSFGAGPRLTWWMALAYYGAPVLVIAAFAFGTLMLIPKPMAVAILQQIRLLLGQCLHGRSDPFAADAFLRSVQLLGPPPSPIGTLMMV